MTRIEIVGGGLGGALAALEAYSQGFRNITLHEAGDRLGGRARPRVVHGQELREIALYFGGPDDPARRRLEEAGIGFEEVDLHCGSVSPTPTGGLTALQDFGGPALACRSLGLAEPAGESLADRIRAYPTEMQGPLSRYAEWRVGGWIDQTHSSAAASIGLERIHPLGADPSTLDEVRRADSLYDDLYGAPAAPGGRGGRSRASLPRDGLAAMFERLQRRLAEIEIDVRFSSLHSPQQALATCAEGGAVVWTTRETSLCKALGLKAAPGPIRPRALYIFKARTERPMPCLVRNFTAEGAVARLHLYESRGQALLAAECVAESSDPALRREIHRLLAAFGGVELVLGDQVGHTVGADRDCLSMAQAASRAAIAAALARRAGPRFILAPCEPWRVAKDLDAIAQDLHRVTQAEPAGLARAS